MTSDHHIKKSLLAFKEIQSPNVDKTLSCYDCAVFKACLRSKKGFELLVSS